MNDIAFCNVSFRDPYVVTQRRLESSIRNIYPDPSLFFWTNEMPPGAKEFKESLYGFKVHAIKAARKEGFKKIVWIDTCAVLKKPIEPLFDMLDEYSVYAVQDNNLLYQFNAVELTQIKAEPDWHLVAGSLYLFDFDNEKSEMIFDMWKNMEKHGAFGTQKFIMREPNDGIERRGHRMDETCLALCLYRNGTKPMPHDKSLYKNDENGAETAIVWKEHFLKEGEKWYDS